MRVFTFGELETCDLIVDAVYEGGASANTSGDPITNLLPGTGNLGGFRACGRGMDRKFVVLYTSGEDKDWPDRIDLSTGKFIYYGDNKTPGRELHQTQRGGNKILRRVFDFLHESSRERIPPFFVFMKYPTGSSSRSVQFKGLAVPGHPELPPTEDLVAVWKTSKGQRFQNYRSIFTILDVPVVSRGWLNDVTAGRPHSTIAPDAWLQWVRTGHYRPLRSEPTTVIRTVEDQTPDTPTKVAILRTVYEYFKDSPRAFETFAARLFSIYDHRVIIDEITRSSIDGGRDAVGRYSLGLGQDPVYVEFALEAKCYRPPIDDMQPNTVGVREVSRLISRIRHRQFGVLVTTSVIARQAYAEVREDRHPVVFICGRDIAEIMIDTGYNTPELVRSFLEREFGNDVSGR